MRNYLPCTKALGNYINSYQLRNLLYPGILDAREKQLETEESCLLLHKEGIACMQYIVCMYLFLIFRECAAL